MSKKYEHNCEACVYVGTQSFVQGTPDPRDFDLYYCTPDLNDDQRISLLARYGNKDYEYISGMCPAAYHNEYVVKEWEQVVLDAIEAAREAGNQ